MRQLPPPVLDARPALAAQVAPLQPTSPDREPFAGGGWQGGTGLDLKELKVELGARPQTAATAQHVSPMGLSSPGPPPALPPGASPLRVCRR